MENGTSSSYKTEGKTMNELIKDVQKGENKKRPQPLLCPLF